MPDFGSSLFRRALRLPALALLALVWVYQRTLSPALPAIFGPACGCRFAPTCSHYAAEAVRTHGAVVGAWLALRRLLRCTPLSAGGYDPVPAPSQRRSGPGDRRPTCVRVGAAAS